MFPSAQQHEAFLADYRRYVVEVVNPTRLRLRSLIDEWRSPAYWERHGGSHLPSPSPVISGLIRVKRPEAVVDKLLRKPDEFPEGLSIASVRKMGDILGARLVVPFLSDVAWVAQELRKRDDLLEWAEKPARAYLSAPDANEAGIQLKRFQRRSPEKHTATLVYWLYFDKNTSDSQVFQLQIVTLMQNAWGNAQRQLGYHPLYTQRADVKEHFENVGVKLREQERELLSIRKALAAAQEHPVLSDDSALSAENLPALLTDVGVSVYQVHLEGMLKVLASRGITTVEAFRSRATSEVISQIRRAYIKEVSWAPEPFEIVATLAMLEPNPPLQDIVHAARLNQQYLESWAETARESATARDNPATFSPRRGVLPRFPRKS